MQCKTDLYISVKSFIGCLMFPLVSSCFRFYLFFCAVIYLTIKEPAHKHCITTGWPATLQHICIHHALNFLKRSSIGCLHMVSSGQLLICDLTRSRAAVWLTAGELLPVDGDCCWTSLAGGWRLQIAARLRTRLSAVGRSKATVGPTGKRVIRHSER